MTLWIKEYPDDELRDTIDTLELMQTVREIRTIAMRNAMENRKADMYEQQLNILQRQYESEHVSTTWARRTTTVTSRIDGLSKECSKQPCSAT